MSLAQLFVNGVVYSCIIILASIGLSLVYSIGNFANFAHGDTMAVGAFGAIVAAPAIQSHAPGAAVAGFPLWFFGALAVGMLVAVVVVVATEYLVYRPLDADPIGLLITSIGVALAYRALLMMQFGSGQRTYPMSRGGRIEWIDEAFGVAVTVRDLVIVLTTILLVVSLHALLQYTTLGRKMRAMADNAELARVAGIRTREVVLAMWIIGGALAAAGGVFLGLDTLVTPRMGFELLLLIFAAVILGGIGSVYGAMLGGFAIGMAHELTPAIPYIGTEYNAAVAFVLLVVILLVRPSGILGGDVE
ncbi:branched-chain amino acid ABC transporter permease [Halovivax sp.]|uniref:branched-chain amino acid ABC transporter permease n=1 Tax=Halovivax sp. TaxID=1935978 RepID=UPI0025C106E0|nr:branched-chain amino acid ABC transporter permease [Halovivax sp.]